MTARIANEFCKAQDLADESGKMGIGGTDQANEFLQGLLGEEAWEAANNR